MSRRAGTPRISPRAAPDKDNQFLEIYESGSIDLFGVHDPGFARKQADGDFLECRFADWHARDILRVDIVVSLAPSALKIEGVLVFEPQVLLAEGDPWSAIRGVRAAIGSYGLSAISTGSVELASAPIVRLHAQAFNRALDYGRGPEPSSLVLRCCRVRQGTYAPSSSLIPVTTW